MSHTPGESRIPVFRSAGSVVATSALPRPTMLVAPSCVPALEPDPPPPPGTVSAEALGQRVCVGGEVTGVLRFFGTTYLDPGGGNWCGVELDTPDGLNDGCVKGVRYFRCRPRYGILAPENKVCVVMPSRVENDEAAAQPDIKRRMPHDKQENTSGPREAGKRVAGRRDKSESSSASSQDETTPPAEDQPSTSRPEASQRQPRSAAATPTPGSSSALPWDWAGPVRRSSHEEGVPIADEALLDEGPSSRGIDSPKDVAMLSPTGSEGGSRSLSQRLLSGGLVLPLLGSPPPGPLPHLSSKQSSFELDDSLGILTPDQMATDFTVTSAGPGSDDEEDRLGSADLGGLMLEEPPPSPPHEEHEPRVEHEDHSEHCSDMSSSAADMAAKGAASTSSQQQSTSCSVQAATASCSFITSVTSITSLDTGYQGDGEWSRPASRADNSPTAPPPPPPGVLAVDVHKLKFDVMTDSDFFSDPGAAGTESDAEHEAAGMTVGDRRARVIDGTLYGTSPANSVAGPLPPAPAHLMTSSAATIEEMDSSGIFSDIERRPDTAESFVPPSKPSKPEPDPKPSENVTIDQTTEPNTSGVLNATKETIVEEPKISSPLPAGTKEEKVMKKHKMPKRNVTSKIKALIESNPTPKPDENQENRRPARKGGKWDAVMNKIAQNQAEEKTRPVKLKEVKSRVFAGIAQSSPQAPKTPARTTVPAARVNISSRPSTARTRRENASTPKPKPRRTRMRGAESSASLRVDEEEEGESPNSSHCSSISDVSQAPSLPKPNPLRSTKKRAAVLDGVAAHVRAGSPLSDVSTNSAPPQAAPRTPINNNNALLHGRHATTNSPAERGKTPVSGAASVQQRNQRNALLSATPPTPGRRGTLPVVATAPVHKAPQDKGTASVTAAAAASPAGPDMKTPLAMRKQTSRLAQKPTPLKDHNRLSGARHSLASEVPGKTELHPAQAAPKNAPAPVQFPLPPHLLKDLKHASAGCEAMAALVQYLVFQLDAFSAPRLKSELAGMREEWLRTKLELEEAQAGYRRLQETLSDELTSHEHREEAQRAQHLQLVAALEAAHQTALATAQAEHHARELNLRDELEEIRTKGVAHEEALQEVSRILDEERASAARRAEESARREAELGEQLAKVSAELADTKADSRKFLESMHKDKDSKLQATAERCQTLEKEVDSLRAVLDLRHNDLQKLRKLSAEAQERADQLASNEALLAAARTKLEDLQSQLDAKASIERELKKENERLLQTCTLEFQHNQRLSQTTEELKWRLQKNSESFKTLAANSPINLSNSMLFPSPILARRSFSHNGTPNGTGSSLNNNSHRLSPGLEDDLPDSPRIKVVAEKSDSVAWVLDMNESVEVYLERIQSNQRQRCQDRSSPGRSLPKKSASTSAMLSDQRGGKLAGRKSRITRGPLTSTTAPETHCRSRSVSTDSESLEMESKSCSSQPDRRDNGICEPKMECLNAPQAASQPTSPSLLSLPFKLQLQPQESAGEAMISEEISDDAQSDCEANQAAEACSGHSSESSSLVMNNGSHLDMEDEEEEDEEEACKLPPAPSSRLQHPGQPPMRSSPTPDSVSQLGLTDSTAMDLSWSEDFELFPSESEG